MGVRAEAARAQLEDSNYLMMVGVEPDLALDVHEWKLYEGNGVNWVGGTNAQEKTKLGGGGRDWRLNEDGTISAEQKPELVLGIWTAEDKQDYRNTQSSRLAAAACGAGLKSVAGWEAVDPAAIQITLLSGALNSPDVVVKCEAGAGVPPVVLRARKDKSDPVREARIEAAATALSRAGVLTRKLGSSADFTLEAWAGEGLEATDQRLTDGFQKWVAAAEQAEEQAKDTGVTLLAQGTAYAESLGRLIGRVSSVPTVWYDEHRAALKTRFPVLRDVPDDCFIWPWAKEEAQFGAFLNTIDQSQMRRLVAAFPAPTSLPMARLATVHGDLWMANICSRPEDDDLVCIDVEWGAVTMAVVEWYHNQSSYCREVAGKLAVTKLEARGLEDDFFSKQTMMAYLSEVGAPCGEKDVAAALFDADWATKMFCPPFVTFVLLESKDPEAVIAYFEQAALQVREARNQHPPRIGEWDRDAVFKQVRSDVRKSRQERPPAKLT